MAGNDPMLGVELFVALKPSPEWVERMRPEAEDAKANGIDLQFTCPREERMVDLRLRTVLVVPLATVPQKEWPAFKVDLGTLVVQDAEGNAVPARGKLVDIEARAVQAAKDQGHPLALMVERALAAAG